MLKTYFITGISTDIGKTLSASLLVNLLEADYWKPVQSGNLNNTDSRKVKNLIKNAKSKVHKETYSLRKAASPHLSAFEQNIDIRINDINLPALDNNKLIIEGAGGILVPINNSEFIIDIAKKFDSEIILVCRNYLGCINHTLLSISYLINNNFRIKGLILNGDFEELVKNSILSYRDIPLLLEIPELDNLDDINSKVKFYVDKNYF